VTRAGVEAHYGSFGLLDEILGALGAAGADVEHLTLDDLAPVEEFHTFGRMGTVALADAAGISAGETVVDLGAGIGGPARYLASERGARVTAVDLTPAFCEVAEELDRRTGLADRIDVHCGSALDLPFDDGTFDVAWTQHASMNIEDKAGLFAEARRVLEPGGRFAMFDLQAGDVQPIHFPVPWAETREISFLATMEESAALLDAAGFRRDVWDDLTDEALAFYERLAAGTPARPGPLSLHLLVPNLPEKGANLARNVREGRLRVLRGICIAV
jgi:SAM-dependent methyltransferase